MIPAPVEGVGLHFIHEEAALRWQWAVIEAFYCVFVKVPLGGLMSVNGRERKGTFYRALTCAVLTRRDMHLILEPLSPAEGLHNHHQSIFSEYSLKPQMCPAHAQRTWPVIWSRRPFPYRVRVHGLRRFRMVCNGGPACTRRRWHSHRVTVQTVTLWLCRRRDLCSMALVPQHPQRLCFSTNQGYYTSSMYFQIPNGRRWP